MEELQLQMSAILTELAHGVTTINSMEPSTLSGFALAQKNNKLRRK
jgi:hypothetical protein